MNEENKEKLEGMTFEAAIARLEEIVRALESGSAPLDESLTLFEEGVSLVKLCNARLDTAEQKVKLLSLNPDGTAEERDMPPMT
ncbi:MAG: exodeoxyribonuclease VII small subunit [Clostridia bacterium]|nr:exodeoxyribonuclease VII small subunit [Clostridia bacterium]MBQ4349856.1 exodeoxyribonuclease VII small subunit [Clostridia bacterium]